MLANNNLNFFHRVTRNSPLLPDYITSSITSISIAALKTEDIQCMILDIDDTLVRRGASQLDFQVIQHLQSLRGAGITLMIGSNTNRDITTLAASIDARVIAKRWWRFKPMKQFYRKVHAASQIPIENTVMVGDKVFNDIIGAKRSGLRTILVTPVRRRVGPVSKLYREYVIRNVRK